MATTRKVLMILLVVICASFATYARGACDDRGDGMFRSTMGYIPLIVTAPLSLAATAVGYTIDGIARVGEPVVIGSLICLPLAIVIAGGHSNSGGYQCFDATTRYWMWSRSNSSTQTDTHVGASIWRETEALRCPL